MSNDADDADDAASMRDSRDLLMEERAATADMHALSRLHELALLRTEGPGLQSLLREVLDTAIDISDSDFGELQLAHPAEVPSHTSSRIDGAALKWLDLLARQTAEMVDGTSTRAELSAERRRLEALLQALPIGVAFADSPDCRHVTGNVALRQMFEVTPSDNVSATAESATAVGRQIDYFEAGRPVAAQDLPLQRAGREGRRIGPVALEVHLPGGRSFCIDVIAAPILGPGGEVAGAVSVLVDTMERRRAEEALEQLRLKDEFLAVLSHELRNPLAAIAAAVDAEPCGDAALAREQIRRQLKVLERLTEDLADASRVANGQMRLNLGPVSLRELMLAARDVAQPMTQLRRQRLVVAPPMPDLCFQGDRVRLLQILMNLLDNASKYGRDDGLIELRGGLEGDEVVLRCRDDGHGIDPYMLRRIFEPLVRAPSARLAAPTGLGLGLTLIQRMAQLHGGSVTASSAGQGRGSEFVLRMPCVAASAGLAHALPGHAPGPAAAPLSTLLVEDHPELAAATAAMLRDEGMQVAVASTGRDAIEIARQQRPRLLLCDLNLPDMSGLQLIATLSEHLRAWNTHVVVLSAHTPTELGVYARRAAEYGVNQFIPKPLGRQQLRTLLQGLRQD